MSGHLEARLYQDGPLAYRSALLDFAERYTTSRFGRLLFAVKRHLWPWYARAWKTRRGRLWAYRLTITVGKHRLLVSFTNEVQA